MRVGKFRLNGMLTIFAFYCRAPQGVRAGGSAARYCNPQVGTSHMRKNVPVIIFVTIVAAKKDWTHYVGGAALLILTALVKYVF